MHLEAEGRMQTEDTENVVPAEDAVKPDEMESAMPSEETNENAIKPDEAESAVPTEETAEDAVKPDETGKAVPVDEADSAKGSEEMEAAIEAILFATGRAVSVEDLARALEVSEKDADSYAASLSGRWNSEKHGTDIIRIENGWQMCTRKDYYPQLIILELTPKKPRLTDVLLETLSVIAYKQPVTKAEIERIRGVNSDHAVNKLVEFHLVKELGRAKLPGRPILFGTTEDFLRVFGVSSKANLPVINQTTVEGFREEAEAEAGVVGELPRNREMPDNGEASENNEASADGEISDIGVISADGESSDHDDTTPDGESSGHDDTSPDGEISDHDETSAGGEA